ncbi:1-acyl-sn-glycerol-3-phosphate acyltransferase [Candidatus Woesearchaeota archaeon]|nr:1-acyl-sn-glycerol-3-phosphate acyltransferase [Candidatus Woesearchaeota archaeon]MBW3022392.1 1-acyl-sn-glycerol-3-phosphate acyltransferase [Candidatus Woesearchaeota archaeon]
MGKEFKNTRVDWFYNFTVSGVIRTLCPRIYNLSIERRERIPEKGPVVVCYKHQYFDDLWMLGHAYEGHYLNCVAKPQLFGSGHDKFYKTAFWTLFGKVIERLGAIPISRQKDPDFSPAKLRKALRYVNNLLDRGEFVPVAPEGTRVPGEVGKPDFDMARWLVKYQNKSGNIITYQDVGIEYSETPKGGTVIMRRPDVIVRIGEQFQIDASDEDAATDELTKRVMKEIRELSGF